MPKVAVITRTKNRPLMLPRARESIQRQNFSDFVWVLVNDAGEQTYVEDAASTARASGVSVKVIHRDDSVGMEAASNAGIRAVDSEYIVIHDDDDSWQPEFLDQTVAYLDENPEYLGVICVSQAVYERVEDDKVVELKRQPYNAGLDSVQIADMAQENPFAPISFLFRRSAYDAVGGFDESLPVLGDWDFNLQMLLKGDIGLMPEMLANYHIRETVAAAQIEYGNSITAGVNAHAIQDAKYRNLKLRQDLNNGRIGLGFLLVQGRQSLRTTQGVHFVIDVIKLPVRIWRRVKRMVGIG